MRAGIICLAALVVAVTVGCDSLNQKTILDASKLTGGGNARWGRVEIP